MKFEKNYQAYLSDKALNEYNKRSELYKSEKLILNWINSNVRLHRMLDIGIGTGRTTKFFAPLFKEYIGIDYSNKMVDKSKTLYKGAANINIYCTDARDIRICKDNYFDFILFSYNGIDCVDHEGRLKVYDEILRVGKNESYFIFSAHNLNYIPKLFSYRIPRNPLKLIKNFYKMKKIQMSNPSVEEILQKDYTTLVDGHLDFSTEYYYIKPSRQIRQLNNIGLKVIKVIGAKKEQELPLGTDWSSINDKWIYYICKINKQD